MGNNAVSMFTPNAGMMGVANAAMRAGGKQAFYGSAYDAAIASGMAYLVGELEKGGPENQGTPLLCYLAARHRCKNRRRMGRFHVHL
ncbi:MAG: hypothetical protein ACLU45_01860 [Dialister invisus]|uniref:hypothetical protein n=1 Tax=Dialister invisus TaxID=218538 RepID=UPI00399C03F2